MITAKGNEMQKLILETPVTLPHAQQNKQIRNKITIITVT